MTLITSLTLKPSIVGSEEIPVNYNGTDYKITPEQIIGALETALDAEIATRESEIEDLQNEKLDLSGGTLTGNLILAGNPTESLHPTTKVWVETQLANKADAVGQSLDSTTTAVTAATTSESTAIATTEFVSNKIIAEHFTKTTINNPTHTLTEAEKGIIFINRTDLSTVAISLPQISALTSTEKTEYFIIDTGLNATTNNITITPFAGDTINEEATVVINVDGQSIYLCNDDTTNWIIKNKPIVATETNAGSLEIATTAEAQSLTLDTKIITPTKLGDGLDATLFNVTNISTATYSLAEDETGLIIVDAGAAVTITLPIISSLTNPNRVIYKIVAKQNAYTYPITINVGTGDTISGMTPATSHIIVYIGETVTLTNNGATLWTAVTNQKLAGTHVHLSADQTIANTTWTPVAFNTIADLNTLTQFNVATYHYVPVRTRYFNVNTTIYFTANATGVRGVRIIENVAGVDKVRAEQIISGYATYNASININAMFASTSNDYIRVDVFQSSGGNLDIQGGTLEDSHVRIIENN